MQLFSLPHFPPKDSLAKHRTRDYRIAVFTFVTVTICLTTDGFAPHEMQYLLAFFGWLFLLAFLRRECKYVRTQVAVAVIFAVLGEFFASIYMQGYVYRFGNLPAYVPAGHGLVYLTAVALGRSGLFQRYARPIAVLVVIISGLWAMWGISSFSQRQDLIGAVLFGVFLVYLFRGKSPLVYLGAFFITSWLEIVGTSAGTWAWAIIDPATKLPQGNPPSGVAAWYCLVDMVAIVGATPVLLAFEKTQQFFRFRQTIFGK
jgi:peptidoglycan/LPS O-acetylase OafA/YrhL